MQTEMSACMQACSPLGHVLLLPAWLACGLPPGQLPDHAPSLGRVQQLCLHLPRVGSSAGL